MRPFATRSAIVVSAFRPAVTAVTVDRLTVRSEIDQTQSRRAVTLIALGVQCSPSGGLGRARAAYRGRGQLHGGWCVEGAGGNVGCMMSLGAALTALPKVELHCHIEGTMRPATLVDLARSNSIPLPTSDPTELYRFDSLDGFLKVFWLGQSTLARREDWARLAYESVVDGADHGVVYRESFFTPARHLAAGQDLAEIVAGLDEGLSAGEAETGASCRLIADMDRSFGPGPGLDLVQRLADLRRSRALGIERVIGIGMDSTETGIDPLSFLPAYRASRAAGFRLTAHQGENSPAAAIGACVEILGVERIDHGVPVLDDAELVRRMVGERIPITVCPTSNVLIANSFPHLKHHVLPNMRSAGLLATVNTDDPAFIDLDLATEYALVAEAFSWGWTEMVEIAFDGVEASWLDDGDKATLRQRIAGAVAPTV
jgi:adenosine deaminase